MILIAEAGHLASQITGHYTAEVSNVDYDVKCPAGSSSVMLLKYEHIEWITETHGISSILKDLVQKYEYKTKEMKIQVFGCCCEGRSSPWDEPKIKSPMPEYITYDINSFLVVSTESTVLRHKKTTIQNRRCEVLTEPVSSFRRYNHLTSPLTGGAFEMDGWDNFLKTLPEGVLHE